MEVSRQNSDDSPLDAIDLDSPADYVGVALKLQLPDFVAQYDAGLTALRVITAKCAPQGSFNAQEFEELGRNLRRQNGDFALCNNQALRTPGVGRDGIQQFAASPRRGQVQQRLGAKAPEFAIQGDDADPVGT